MGVNRQQFLDKFLNNDNPVQVYPAEVVSVAESTCTVRLLASGLEVEDVRLVADVDASDFFRLKPKPGSTVLVGCVENDVANLYVAQCAEVDVAEVVIGELLVTMEDGRLLAKAQNCEVEVQTDKVTIRQAGTTIELQGGRVKISNGTVSLKDLFSDLTTLLNTFIVLTPAGPSTALGPNSVVALAQLSVKFNQLLS